MSFGQQGALSTWAVIKVGSAVLARVVEAELLGHRFEIIHMHLRIELLSAMRTNCRSTFLACLPINRDPKLGRALDDVIKLSKRHPEDLPPPRG